MLAKKRMEKQIKKKSRFKKVLLLLLVFSFMFALTGCDNIPCKSKSEGSSYFWKKDKVVYIKAPGISEQEIETYLDGSFGTVDFTDNYKNADKNIGKELKGSTMRDVARLMLNSTFGEELITYSDFNKNKWDHFTTEPVDLIKKVNTSITTELKDNTALDQVSKVIQSAAAAILITVWAMGFISQIVNEKFTMETLLKTLMQLMCGILIILNAKIFTEAFAGTGNLIVDKLSSVGDAPAQFGAFKQELSDMLSNIDFSIVYGDLALFKITSMSWSDQSTNAVLLLLFPFIMQVVCAYKIVSMLIMRTFELMIRTTFAPIPLAFSAQNGFSEGAIRYFRGIFACALQPALMIVGACCLESIATIALNIFGGGNANQVTGFTASMAMGASYFILSTFLGQVKQLANEVIAH